MSARAGMVALAAHRARSRPTVHRGHRQRGTVSEPMDAADLTDRIMIPLGGRG